MQTGWCRAAPPARPAAPHRPPGAGCCSPPTRSHVHCPGRRGRRSRAPAAWCRPRPSLRSARSCRRRRCRRRRRRALPRADAVARDRVAERDAVGKVRDDRIDARLHVRRQRALVVVTQARLVPVPSRVLSPHRLGRVRQPDVAVVAVETFLRHRGARLGGAGEEEEGEGAVGSGGATGTKWERSRGTRRGAGGAGKGRRKKRQEED